MSDKLDATQMAAALEQLPGWTLKDDAIEKSFTVTSFPDAVALVTRIAFDAEAVDHHPDLLLEYRRLTVRYWTHTAGGVTQKDIDGAAMAERLVAPFVAPDK
jgi:4a-hydroxytetrahydrobiopterin dehydratase